MMQQYWTYVPKRFQQETFESFHPKTKEQARARFILKQNAKKNFTHNILLLGACGTGKTHLGYAFLKECSQKNPPPQEYFLSKKCFFVSMKELIDELKQTFSMPSYEKTIYQKALEAPVLILDEIGLQYGTHMERTELYRLFNERYNAMKPIIGISNLSAIQLKKLLGQRIFERLFSGAEVFYFKNLSFRFNAHS